MDDVRILNLLVQTGSFGVLVLIVLWMIKFVPKRIEKADELRKIEAEEKTKAAEIVRDSIKNLMDTHKEELQYEREICESRQKHIEGMLTEMLRVIKEDSSRHYELLRDVGHGVKDVQQSWANERALQKMQAAKKPPHQER